MKGKHNGGFSLVECLVAIAILALITIPTCTGMIMSVRLNGKTDQLMQAQLAVSSAVETLMAEGIPKGTAGGSYENGFSNVSVTVTPQITGDPDIPVEAKDAVYYDVQVTSIADTSVTVSTSIRAVALDGEGESS